MLGKQDIVYENCYRNNGHSALLAKARTNSLQLEEHLVRGKTHYDKTCKLCVVEEENLENFLVKCTKLESERSKRIMEGTAIPAQEKTIEILFRNNNHQEIALMIKKMWNLRKRMRDDLRPP